MDSNKDDRYFIAIYSNMPQYVFHARAFAAFVDRLYVCLSVRLPVCQNTYKSYIIATTKTVAQLRESPAALGQRAAASKITKLTLE